MLEVNTMKQKKKSRFFTFMFSLLPGAAEMYMGFMKNGFTLMVLFFLSFVPMLFFSSLDFLMVLGVVIWFYGFFHARNYAGMADEEFAAMDDHYIWEEFTEFKGVKLANNTTRKVVAAVLIVLGLGQLWSYFSSLIYSLIPGAYWDELYPVVKEIPQVLIAVLFVIAGIAMIRGKKKELNAAPDVEVKRIAEIPQKQETPVAAVDSTQSKEA